MRQQLQLHPDCVCDALTGVEVEVVRTSSGLMLHYLLAGSIADIRLPPPEPPRRGHQLWEHSCFEVFIRPAGGEAYCEYNLAPCRQWAAYRFARHRSRMADIGEAETPQTQQAAGADRYAMRAALDLSEVPDLAGDELWHVNVSVIVEETNGRKSYWALAHPPGKADFHDPACFVLDLPPAA